MIGIPVGVLGSFLAWWIIYHRIIPIVRFSEDICKDKYDPDNTGFRYRIKLENYGRRAILDLELIARYRVKGLFKGRPGNWKVVYIPLHNNRIFNMPPVKKSHFREMVRINLNEASEFNNIIFSRQIRTKLKNKLLLLEDLLSLGADSTLQIYGFGFDEFSGVRKFVKSKVYKKNDIKFGEFNKKGLNVIEAHNN